MIEIFDLDGTLWMPKSTPLCVSEVSLTHPKWANHGRDYRLLPGVQQAISHLHSQGATIVIATNQGGLPWNVEVGQKCSSRGVEFRPYRHGPGFKKK